MSVYLSVLIYLYTIDKSRHTGKKFVQVEIIKIEPGNTITPFAGVCPHHKNGERKMAREGGAHIQMSLRGIA